MLFLVFVVAGGGQKETTRVSTSPFQTSTHFQNKCQFAIKIKRIIFYSRKYTVFENLYVYSPKKNSNKQKPFAICFCRDLLKIKLIWTLLCFYNKWKIISSYIDHFHIRWPMSSNEQNISRIIHCNKCCGFSNAKNNQK